VQFKYKFPRYLSLEELRRHHASGGPLKDIILFRQSRLSVQRITEDEFKYIEVLAHQPPSF